MESADLLTPQGVLGVHCIGNGKCTPPVPLRVLVVYEMESADLSSYGVTSVNSLGRKWKVQTPCPSQKSGVHDVGSGKCVIPVFQITSKVRESMKNSEGSIGVVLSQSS